ncbi:uncharacterized protein LOC143037572 [Oratosquilla oratoria]|uniref:uncharacterized protein LOC143037572 n=1 Tax=Oratosquilla oratoria TaxID=337810 RepID=UPI003F75DD26
MEVLLLPNQRLKLGEVFNPLGHLTPQLPILKSSDDHLHFLIFGSTYLKEMVHLNPKIKEMSWFKYISSSSFGTLIVTLFRSVTIKQTLVQGFVFQKIYGVVGHLHLQSLSPEGRMGERTILEGNRFKNWIEQYINTDTQCNFEYDISKQYKYNLFYGDKIQCYSDLKEAFQTLKHYVVSSTNNEVCLVLEQGPFPKETFHGINKLNPSSTIEGDSQVCNLQPHDQIYNQKDNQMLQEPLAGLPVQSQISSTLSGSSCKVKGSDKEPLQIATAGLYQTGTEEKCEDLKHKEEKKTCQDMLHCSMKQETENYCQDSQIPCKRNKKATPTSMSMSESTSHVGGDHAPEARKVEGVPGLPLTSKKSHYYHDQNEEDILKGNTGQGLLPKAFSADHSNSSSISHKNQNASLLVQEDHSLTSSKADLSMKKIPSHLCLVEVVSSSTAKEDDCGIQRKYFGSTASVTKARTILLLGAKGSGKTCLINAVANFILGIKSNTEKKLVVSDEVAETGFTSTDNITSYTFAFKDHEEDVALTVIDTPGLNDSSGNEVRDHVESLKTFLSNVAHKELKIHCIAFVVQAHLVRLTSSERLVMDIMKTLFGQAVSDHMVNLITFADNQKPPVVEALDHYGLSTKHCFSFNNSIFCGSLEESEEVMSWAYWKMSHKSWKRCWKVVQNLSPLKSNIMMSIQKELYMTNVRNSTIQELHVEMKNFLDVRRRANSLEIGKVRNRIWDLAYVVYHTMQENDRQLYTSVDELIEKKFNDCNTRGDGSREDLYALKLVVPMSVLKSVKVIIEGSMNILRANKTLIHDLSYYYNKTEWTIVSFKNYVMGEHNIQEQASLAEDNIRAIEDIVITMTFESIRQLVEHNACQLHSKLTPHSLLSLLKAQMKGMQYSKISYSWMVDKLLECKSKWETHNNAKI